MRLLYVLPHLPPEILEWEGTAEPANEREAVAEKKAQFVVEAEKTAQPTVAQARRILNEAGVPEDAIETQFYPVVAVTVHGGTVPIFAARLASSSGKAFSQRKWTSPRRSVNGYGGHAGLKSTVSMPTGYQTTHPDASGQAVPADCSTWGGRVCYNWWGDVRAA